MIGKVIGAFVGDKIAKQTSGIGGADRPFYYFDFGADADIPTMIPLRRTVNGVTEWPGISTNAASQFGLTAIQMLDLVPTALDGLPFPPKRPRRPGEGE